MDSPIKPIFLFADSQLLFWRQDDGSLFLERIRKALDPDSSAKAAYLGASNGDQPEFFQLFQGAMAGAEIHDCRMIPAEPSQEDMEYFEAADIVLLAGGDPRRGWKAFQKNGIAEKLVQRYADGVLLMGVSAGAVQLGLGGWSEEDTGFPPKMFATFKLVPYQVDVHDEPDWARMNGVLPKAREPIRGLGVPSGGGAVIHPDLTVEPVRQPLVEFAVEDDKVSQALLFPPDPDHPERNESNEDQPKTFSVPPEVLGSDSEDVH